MVSILKNLHHPNTILHVSLLFSFSKFSISSSSIKSFPELRNNTYAYGFDNLTLIAKLDKCSSGGCIWNINNKYEGELGVKGITICNEVTTCEVSSICEEIKEDDVTYIVSEVTITKPITYDVNATVACDSLIVTSWNGTAKNCSNNTEWGATVDYDSSQYKCSGEFTCGDKKTLVTSNGNVPSTNQTSCQLDAEWSKQENLTCSIVCPETTPNNVSVCFETVLAITNSSGEFSCDEAYILFNTNVPEHRMNNRTTCSDNGQWENQEEVECWKAPIVEILGSVTILEGKNLTLTCNYTDVYPSGDVSEFFVDTISCRIPKALQLTAFGSRSYLEATMNMFYQMVTSDIAKLYNLYGKGASKKRRFKNLKLIKLYSNESFVSKNVSRFDNGKPVYCKAITPYTEAFNELGCSEVKTLEVQYEPVINNTSGCTWEINMTGICNISIDSNPVVTSLDSLKKNGDDVEYFQIANITKSTQTIFSFIETEVTYENNGTYIMIVTTSEDFKSIELKFKILVVSSSTTKQSSLTLTIALSCVGAVLGIILIIGLFLVFWKRNRGFCNRKNELKKDELSGHENFQEPQLSMNELYQPIQKKDSVTKTTKGNDLYVPLDNQSNSLQGVKEFEPTYSSQVEVTKKEQTKSFPAMPNTKDVYAQVDKNKSRKNMKKTSDADAKVKDLYAQVDIKKKKNPATTQKEM